MNLGQKERRIVLNWFDVAVECVTLSDEDLKLYDKIRESVEDDADENDPLVYNPSPKKKANVETFEDEDEDDSEFGYFIEEFSDEDDY